VSRLRLLAPGNGPVRGRGERGAGIIEFAMVALILFTLAAGAFDYGQAWRSGLGINEAVRTGARVGSAGGTDRATDFNALSGLKAALASSEMLEGVVRVVVFRSDASDGSIPETCKTSSTNECQVISGDQFRTEWEDGSVASATQTNGCLNIASARNWCPTNRINSQATAQYYGVWVQFRHDYFFPLMGDGVTIERTAVMRLEPKVD